MTNRPHFAHTLGRGGQVSPLHFRGVGYQGRCSFHIQGFGRKRLLYNVSVSKIPSPPFFCLPPVFGLPPSLLLLPPFLPTFQRRLLLQIGLGSGKLLNQQRGQTFFSRGIGC